MGGLDPPIQLSYRQDGRLKAGHGEEEMKMPVLLALVIATALEVTGDAMIRKGIYEHAGAWRIGLFLAGMALLTGYGTFLNLAPLEFGEVVGLYIATLFVVWQVVTYFAFGTLPTLPILVGGALIVAGGLLVSFWKAA
jgi:small multidrug resistance family-3 protein